MSFTLSHQTPTRQALLRVMEAALHAVDPFAAVLRLLRRDGETLHIADRAYDLGAFERVWLIGGGKAGAPMAQAVEAALGDVLTGGLVVVKYDHRAPLERVELREAAHPVPDTAGLEAGAAMLAIARRAGARDLVFCVLSGGGSALLESLPAPLTLNDLRETTAALLRSGATINEVNAVRKHLSLIKGGQLARAVAPATLVTLVLSDVVGSPLDVIASGPTVPDRSTWADASEVVSRYDLSRVFPAAVKEYLALGASGSLPETPRASDPLFERMQVVIVGDNASAAAAALAAAEAEGYQSLILTTFLQGEARELAKVAAALGQEVQAHGRPIASPACLILGGESTVTLSGNGKGGRNQELALAAALALEGSEGITIASLATDGSDGPTDSAGAMVDGGTVRRADNAGLSAATHLATHNAYPLLDAAGDLLRSGPTNTNVNDLILIVVEGPLQPTF